MSAQDTAGAGGCGAALSYELGRQLAGTVEADDLYHTAGHKGQAEDGRAEIVGPHATGASQKREAWRGHYDKDRPAIIAWVSRQGGVIHGPGTLRSRRCRRPPTSPCKPAVGSTRTQPAATG